MKKSKSICIVVNEKPVRGTVEARTSLADFIRNDCLLTGTHIGCEHGVCGACTLLMDGEPVRSCITLAAADDLCPLMLSGKDAQIKNTGVPIPCKMI